jgi:hypothetical protein
MASLDSESRDVNTAEEDEEEDNDWQELPDTSESGEEYDDDDDEVPEISCSALDAPYCAETGLDAPSTSQQQVRCRPSAGALPLAHMGPQCTSQPLTAA